MCPLYPLHIALLYLCLLLPFLLALVDGAESLAGWRLSFSQDKIGDKTDKFRELTSRQFEVECDNCVQDRGGNYKLKLKNENPRIAFMQYGDIVQVRNDHFGF